MTPERIKCLPGTSKWFKTFSSTNNYQTNNIIILNSLVVIILSGLGGYPNQIEGT
jgi:hypothetical protein